MFLTKESNWLLCPRGPEGRKAGRMHPIPKWQCPDRWVTLPCARAHTWPDAKCPLFPTALTLTPAHLKALHLGYHSKLCCQAQQGPKGQFSRLRLAIDEASPCAEQGAVMAMCNEVWCIPMTSSGTFSKPSRYHRNGTDEKTKFRSLPVPSNHFQLSRWFGVAPELQGSA